MNWEVFFTLFFGVIAGLVLCLGLVALTVKASDYIGDRWAGIAMVLVVIVSLSALFGLTAP